MSASFQERSTHHRTAGGFITKTEELNPHVFKVAILNYFSAVLQSEQAFLLTFWEGVFQLWNG